MSVFTGYVVCYKKKKSFIGEIKLDLTMLLLNTLYIIIIIIKFKLVL